MEASQSAQDILISNNTNSISSINTTLTDVTYSSNITKIDNILCVGNATNESVLCGSNGTITEVKLNNNGTNHYSIQNDNGTFRIKNSTASIDSYTDGNVLMSLSSVGNAVIMGGLTANNVDVLNSISSINTTLTDISFSTDTTTINNNVVISAGKTLTLDGVNIGSSISTINTKLTGFSYDNISDTTIIDNRIEVQTNNDTFIPFIKMKNNSSTTAKQVSSNIFAGLGAGEFSPFCQQGDCALICQNNTNDITGDPYAKGVVIAGHNLSKRGCRIDCSGSGTTEFVCGNFVINSTNVLSSINSINTTLTDISFASDTTTINNNVVISSGKSLTVDGVNIGSAISNMTPVGTIIQGLWASAPSGYLLCVGQQVSTTTYSALYAVIGNFYNSYNPSPDAGNFWLPDFRGAFFRQAGVSSYNSAYNGGTLMTPVNDAVRRHRHEHTRSTGTQSASAGTGATCRDNSSTGGFFTDPEIYEEASSNRGYEGDENRPFAISCNFAIKF